MQEGWLCPRCDKVNAPWMSQCTCGSADWTCSTGTVTNPCKVDTRTTGYPPVNDPFATTISGRINYDEQVELL